MTLPAINPGRMIWRPTVLVVVIDPEGRALLGLRGPGARAGAGEWSPPGGGLEPEDDDVEAAARREVREETGLELAHVAAVGWSEGHTGSSGRPYLSIHVVAEAADPGALVNREPGTFERWEWRAFGDLPSPLWSADDVPGMILEARQRRAARRRRHLPGGCPRFVPAGANPALDVPHAIGSDAACHVCRRAAGK